MHASRARPGGRNSPQLSPLASLARRVTDSSSTLLMLAFPDAAAAEEALARVRDLDVRDAAVVVRTAAGRVELHQTSEVAPGEGIVGGGAIGLIVGFVLGVPVGGALLGLVGGAGFGVRDTGIPDPRLRQLGGELQPGQAVLCVLVDAERAAGTRDALGRYGEVLETELSTTPPP
jgi:uncharacterized membrane protein